MNVIDRIKRLEARLRAQGVTALYLYGSYARDEARPDSDLDILVELDAAGDQSLTRYLQPYEVLEASFPNVEIGYGTRDNIAPAYRNHIEQSAVRIF